MSDSTYHLTSEDLRKIEEPTRLRSGGDLPAESGASMLKSTIYKNKQDPEEVRKNLPREPEPEGMDRFKGQDVRNTAGVGSGRYSGDARTDEMRQPVVKESAAREGEGRHKETTL